MELHLLLTPQDLAYLGTQMTGWTDFSPFASLKANAEEADLDKMKAAGILDMAGKMTPAAREELETMARADACSRILIATPMGTMEKTVFFHEGKKLVADTNAEGLTVTCPAPAEEFMNLCADLFSTSNLCTVPIDMTLTQAEMSVYLGLCDVVRRRILEQLSGNARDYRKITPEQLWRSQAVAWTNGLVRMAAAAMPGEVPDKEELASAVRSLVEKGICEVQEGDVRLRGEALTAAANFMLVDSSVQIDRFILHAGKPMGERTFVMYAGLHDIWAMRPAGDVTMLRSISARALLFMIDQAFNHPLQ